MCVAGIEDHVLILVLDVMQFLDYLVMEIVETQERNDLSRHVFEAGVGLNVLLKRIAHRQRAVIQPFVLPNSVELFNDIVGDIEAGPHTRLVVRGIQESRV